MIEEKKSWALHSLLRVDAA